MFVTDSNAFNPVQGDLATTLANDEYFVLSDNSAPSLDSRTFGPIKTSVIIGKVISRNAF